ncbi:hypothetical protein JC2156_04200 [Weissella koreensis KCTC 3621]|uniref:putative phage tail protein n=1 Tax=Weissella koreensis TaxID=165096 RepID=UPI00026F3641|nr:putative phage tail protein [Weissella koreensis]EJF33710.1 hypothetical protein JC2156_05240 [Weissella koreensis KCTC 3621]EJF34112.1 hypothetical protein JC2156_04200 [Weissella koreensis KCTC 3621]
MPRLIRLIDLMPTYYDEVLEMNTILSVEQPILDELEVVMEEQAANQFVMTADEKGIGVWETLVGIKSDNSMDLESRRYNVLALILPANRITIRYLRKLLTSLNINANLTVDGPNFKVNVDFYSTDMGASKRLTSLLRALLPANLSFTAINSGESSENTTIYTGVAGMYSRINTNKGETNG